MKNKIIALLVCLICGGILQAQAQTNGFILNGQFKGLPDGTKIYLCTQEHDTIAKTISKGEQFSFKGELQPDGRFHFIKIDTLVSKVGSKAIFLVNGAVDISGSLDVRDIVVRGSKGHEDYKVVLDSIAVMKRNRLLQSGSLSLLNDSIKMAKKIGDSSAIRVFSQRKQEAWRQIEIISIEQNAFCLRWIKSHPTSLYSPYLISGMWNNLKLEEIKRLYDEVALEVKNSYYGRELKKAIDLQELSAKIYEGGVVPNFSIIDQRGKVHYIHDIAAKNKFTLIDFWASWCKPCRAEVPKLKKIYDKFKDKGFAIAGISTDQDNVAWKKAVKEDQSTWPHFIQDGAKQISKTFDLKAIPAYVIINSNGKLIAFDCAMSAIKNFGGGLRGVDLERKLEELLGK